MTRSPPLKPLPLLLRLRLRLRLPGTRRKGRRPDPVGLWLWGAIGYSCSRMQTLTVGERACAPDSSRESSVGSPAAVAVVGRGGNESSRAATAREREREGPWVERGTVAEGAPPRREHHRRRCRMLSDRPLVPSLRQAVCPKLMPVVSVPLCPLGLVVTAPKDL